MKANVGVVQPPRLLNPNVIRAVDHDLGYVGIVQKGNDGLQEGSE